MPWRFGRSIPFPSRALDWRGSIEESTAPLLGSSPEDGLDGGAMKKYSGTVRKNQMQKLFPENQIKRKSVMDDLQIVEQGWVSGSGLKAPWVVGYFDYCTSPQVKSACIARSGKKKREKEQKKK